MNEALPPAALDRSHAIYHGLAARAAALGAALWHFSSDGALLAAPDGAAHHADAARSAAGEMLPNCVRIEDRHGSVCVAVFVAVVSDPDRVAEIAAVLKWAYDDIARHESDSATIGQFSERLEQAYEESQMLYRMARMLNRVQRPAESLRGIVAQLHGIAPFGWLALQFADTPGCTNDLRGATMLSGRLPIDSAALRAYAGEKISRVTDDDWTRIQTPATDDLARLTSSEVLVEPIMDDGRPVSLLVAGNKGGDDPALGSFETQLLDACADFIGIFHQNAARLAEQKAMFLGTLQALTGAIDAKDPYTRGHSERVALLASLMARTMGLTEDEIETYRIAGMVHDVGKIGVPEAVLRKAARLDDEEFGQVKLHPAIGHAILQGISAFTPMLPGVRHHHEKYNGTGYPDGLAGEAIPRLARVLALADTFDAMSSSRAYRSGMDRGKVLAEIERCAGSQFDPELARIFITLDFTSFDELIAHNQHQAPAAKAA